MEKSLRKQKGEILIANLKRRRKELGMTQKDLAQKSGVSYGNLKQIESGWKGKYPRPETIEALARPLMVDPLWLTDHT